MFNKKKVDQRIQKFQDFVTKDLTMMTRDPQMTEEKYFIEGRAPMNVELIGILIGADFKEPKAGKECKLRFVYPIPDNKQLANIIAIVNAFIDTAEAPFLNRVGSMDNDDETNDTETSSEDEEDDIEIPNEGYVVLTNSTYNVRFISNINKKQMRNAIFGYSGEENMSAMYLNAMDIIQIAAMGEDLRKKVNKNRIIIAGGIALLVGAGMVGTAIALNHHKKKKEEDDVVDDIDTPEISQIDDIDPIDNLEESVPIIEMDTDTII